MYPPELGLIITAERHAEAAFDRLLRENPDRRYPSRIERFVRRLVHEPAQRLRRFVDQRPAPVASAAQVENREPAAHGGPSSAAPAAEGPYAPQGAAIAGEPAPC